MAGVWKSCYIFEHLHSEPYRSNMSVTCIVLLYVCHCQSRILLVLPPRGSAGHGFISVWICTMSAVYLKTLFSLSWWLPPINVYPSSTIASSVYTYQLELQNVESLHIDFPPLLPTRLNKLSPLGVFPFVPSKW